MLRQLDILGLGCVAVDDLLYVENFPTPDTKSRISHHERQCGGLTATALVAAARLGSRCAFAGILGNDADSAFVLRTFERERVDVSQVRIRADARPIHSTIIVDRSRLTRTILFDLAGTVGAQTDWPPEELIRSAGVLYVDHYGIEGMTRAARLARSAGIPVVADLERDEWPGFHELMDLVDHLIVSRQFAGRLTGSNEPQAAVQALWSGQRQLVAVTCGDDGCWYRADADDVPRHQPAFAVEVVDPTGCGDVFHGAYASALARGLPAAERIRFASAAAALKAKAAGGQAGIPRREQVEELLAQFPRFVP
jgi:sugar/nucleoside kinase (ribokinase family)